MKVEFIKPCPFCGCKANVYTPIKFWENDEFVPAHYELSCDGCRASMSKDTLADAITAWNMREREEDSETVEYKEGYALGFEEGRYYEMTKDEEDEE